MSESTEALNILVIDDEPELRSILGRLLNREQHQVVLTESAEDALSLLPHWTFHIAFVDNTLPGMEGLVLGEYLRRNNSEMSIVMMTGSGDPRIERRSRDLALQFLPKPFHNRDILQIVEDYLLGASERDARRQAQGDDQFEPPIESFVEEIGAGFGLPRIPERVEDSLGEAVKRYLSNLGSAARYTERDRVMALAGLLTARVLGASLPKAKSGLSLFEEYDRLMAERGRRTEFSVRTSIAPPSSSFARSGARLQQQRGL